MKVRQVAHVVESTHPEAGSVGLMLRGLNDALQDRRIQCELVALQEHGGNGRARGGIDSVLKRADVVHLQGWGTTALERAAYVATEAGKPLVISPYGGLCDSSMNRPSVGERFLRWFRGPRVLRRASVITAINEFEKHALESHVPHGRAEVLPCGLRTSPFAARPDGSASTGRYESRAGASAAVGTDAMTPSDSAGITVLTSKSTEADAAVADVIEKLAPGRVALVLGPLHPAEGLVPLLMALAELGPVGDGWNMVLAGPEIGPWRRQLEAAVGRKGAADRVCFTTASNEPTQCAWLHRADVVLCPSLQPRCPVSLLQALCAGVPVIATHVVVPSGLEDCVRVCAPTRPELREALRAMFSLSDEERSERGNSARQAAVARIDWNAAAASYVALYERLFVERPR